MPVTPRTPPGVLELLPAEQIAHQRMLDTIRRGFERFGFLPVETPVFEVADVLLTKTGGETEKQVYFVQSTGALEKFERGTMPELAMRFDLTVPLARYVAQHENQLNFPFRRYQIQRVYRGERAQKGRYREFYQCDIDVIGKDKLSTNYDAELPAVIYGIFTELGFGKFTISLNNRRLLRGLLDSIGIVDHAAALHELDRLGKISSDEVATRLVAAGTSSEAADRLLGVVSSVDPFAALRQLPVNELLTTGIAELETVYRGALALGVPADSLKLDLAIARGLDYYTGTVYETFLDAHRELGSICSGGRYDDLAGHYTKSKLPGVGISIGATRLFSKLLELGALPKGKTAIAEVIVLRVDANLAGEYAAIAKDLRDAGHAVEVYGDDDKLGKQLKYADRAKVPLAVILGGREREAGIVKVKDLRVGEGKAPEHDVPRGELVARVAALLTT